MKRYLVKRCAAGSARSGGWDGPEWQDAEVLPIDNFRPESSDHRPAAAAKLLHDGRSVHVFFKVSDRFVRCSRSGYRAQVWKDSCVEWFVRPRPDRGYFNLEVNCGGALYSSYVVNPERTNGGLKESTPLSREACGAIGIRHSLPAVVEPEIVGPVEWTVALSVPLAVFEPFTGPLGPLSGQEWRANFYKCGDETSRPHWAAWSPVSELNFHRPHEFGAIRFQ